MKYVGYSTRLRPHGISESSGRWFPWDKSEAYPTERYIDLKAHPERVDEALSDLALCRAHPAAQATVDLVLAMNAPDSFLETSDFAFRCPAANHPVHVMPWMNEFPFIVHGRLMFLYRNLLRNTSDDDVDSLGRRFAHFLSNHPSPDAVVVHFGIAASKFAALPGEPEGWESVASFWALGNAPDEAMSNYGCVVAALHDGFRRIAAADTAAG